MMNTSMLSLVGAAAMALGAHAGTIDKVVVRQQWPWNAKVNIDYRLLETDGKTYDIDVTLKNGDETLTIPAASLSGDLYSVGPGERRIVWDPAKTAYVARRELANLTVTLTAVDIESRKYLIIDMSEGAVNGEKPKPWPVSYSATVIDADGDGQWDDEYKRTKMVFRRIEPGSFTMGCPSTEPDTWSQKNKTGSENQHQVTLTKPFYMGVFEVTAQQFYQIKAWWPNAAYGKSTATGNRPSTNCSYEFLRGSVAQGIDWPTTGHAVYEIPSVTEFSNYNHMDANKISLVGWFRRHIADTGLLVDLPTEAMWEYCCRAGSTHTFYDGTDLVSGEIKDVDPSGSDPTAGTGIYSIAKFKKNSMKYDADVGTWSDPKDDGDLYGPGPVGSKAPNAWGLYDMHGSVNEWVLDWFAAAALPDATDPVGVTTGTQRGYRGGGYTSYPSDSRAAMRGAAKTTESNMSFGYRFAIYLGAEE